MKLSLHHKIRNRMLWSLPIVSTIVYRSANIAARSASMSESLEVASAGASKEASRLSKSSSASLLAAGSAG
jgi:hypothetical protein